MKVNLSVTMPQSPESTEAPADSTTPNPDWTPMLKAVPEGDRPGRPTRPVIGRGDVLKQFRYRMKKWRNSRRASGIDKPEERLRVDLLKALHVKRCRTRPLMPSDWMSSRVLDIGTIYAEVVSLQEAMAQTCRLISTTSAEPVAKLESTDSCQVSV